MTDYDKFVPARSHRCTSRSGQPSKRTARSCSAATAVAASGSSRASDARAARPQYTWTPIAGTGEMYTYTVVHRAPTPAYQADAPYVIAHVTLDEGPRMISTLVGCDPGAVTVGMPVEIIYDDVTPELTLYRFRPTDSSTTSAVGAAGTATDIQGG